MANNYSRATLEPTEVFLTEEQQIVLMASGAGLELRSEEPSPLEKLADAANEKPTLVPLYYVYWEENYGDYLDADEIEEQFYQFYDDGAPNDAADRAEWEREIKERSEQLANTDMTDLLHQILMNPENNELEHLTIEGSYSCSKMRPGEFGGFSCVVTREEWAWVNTNSAIEVEDGKLITPGPKRGVFEKEKAHGTA